MRKSLIYTVLIIGILAIMTGCGKDTGEDKGATMAPDIKTGLEQFDSLVDEVDKVMDYVYLDGERPNKDYMNSIDKELEERDNQRIYMDEFLQEIEDLARELDESIEQLPDNVEEEIYEMYEGDDMEVDVGKDSDIIKKDSDGRDYIAIKDLDYMGKEILITYKGVEYIIDLEEYKPTSGNIRLGQHTFRCLYGQEGDGEDYLLYMDTKTGVGKTVTIEQDDGGITNIDFEI